MVGCVAESLTLELRDHLLNKMKSLEKTISKNLTDWKIRTVCKALQKEFESQKKNMDRNLRESFEAYWPAFTQQLRTVRNDAGHPSSVEPITDRSVHSSLLIFPELAILSSKIKGWINNGYT